MTIIKKILHSLFSAFLIWQTIMLVERLLKICGRIIQIDLFKKLLIRTIWNRKQNEKYFFSGFRNGFSDLEITTMKSEFGHFIGFCIVMILTIIIGIKAGFLQAILILIINIFFNFYPFMLQRFHRLRLNELKGRFRVDMV